MQVALQTSIVLWEAVEIRRAYFGKPVHQPENVMRKHVSENEDGIEWLTSHKDNPLD